MSTYEDFDKEDLSRGEVLDDDDAWAEKSRPIDLCPYELHSELIGF